MSNYPAWNADIPLASIEEMLDSERRSDALSLSSYESESVGSENGTSPKISETTESDTNAHPVSSTVRETSPFKQHELTDARVREKDSMALMCLMSETLTGQEGEHTNIL